MASFCSKVADVLYDSHDVSDFSVATGHLRESGEAKYLPFDSSSSPCRPPWSFLIGSTAPGIFLSISKYCLPSVVFL